MYLSVSSRRNTRTCGAPSTGSKGTMTVWLRIANATAAASCASRAVASSSDRRLEAVTLLPGFPPDFFFFFGIVLAGSGSCGVWELRGLGVAGLGVEQEGYVVGFDPVDNDVQSVGCAARRHLRAVSVARGRV
jgi:hypothetical protein